MEWLLLLPLYWIVNDLTTPEQCNFYGEIDKSKYERNVGQTTACDAPPKWWLDSPKTKRWVIEVQKE